MWPFLATNCFKFYPCQDQNKLKIFLSTYAITISIFSTSYLDVERLSALLSKKMQVLFQLPKLG